MNRECYAVFFERWGKNWGMCRLNGNFFEVVGNEAPKVCPVCKREAFYSVTDNPDAVIGNSMKDLDLAHYKAENAELKAKLEAAVSSEREACAKVCHEYAERARADRRKADTVYNDAEAGNRHHNRAVAAQELEQTIRAIAEAKG